MDEAHLEAAFRYILLNPVRSKLVKQAQEWRWSSAQAFLNGRDDGLTVIAPMRRRIPGLKTFLGDGAIDLDEHVVRDDETIGRPRGDEAFIRKLEAKTGRKLRPGRRGPKPSAMKKTKKKIAR